MRVYRYDLRPPTENEHIVREQMRLASRYYNTLIEIERGRRAAVREVMRTAGLLEAEQRAHAAQAVLDAALAAERADRAATRSRSASAELRAATAAARTQNRAAVNEVREIRRRLKEQPELRIELDAINERALELNRSARKFCGVYWGTYNAYAAAAAKAAADVDLYDGAAPADPRFMRFDGTGRVAVQLQGGIEVAELADDSQLQITPLPPPGTWDKGRTWRARRPWVALRMRVQSDGRAPVWASWPMVMHRPLPDGARIVYAEVVLRRTGPTEEWCVCITIDAPARVRTGTSGVVGIDLGWRRVPTGIRVAVWHGSDGKSGEIVMQGEGALQKCSDLQSIRDQHFDFVRVWLRCLLDALPARPEWIEEATRYMSMWRSQGRLAALIRRWRERRFDGDEAAYEGAEAWRGRDKHLWLWEAHARAKTLRRRTAEYSVAVRRLAEQYQWLSLEGGFDLTQFARRVPTSADTDGTELRVLQRLAAPGELRRLLRNAFGEYVIEPDAANTTRTCAECGHCEAFDAAASITHACVGCGAVWDQDRNAARNLCELGKNELEAASARIKEKQNLSAQDRESRWSRARRLRQEKEARMEAARKAEPSAAQ